ncbi:hypothetical protein CANARDRAFT_200903 [[Candida] arabinofermentans NRRL YB-2248]|uniref:Bacterial surface antigen (D15) domain-containing protein n=1 Tax=[Candida] arabinofermentans NRRL YB-2248 TaxID=983967 RepID=A0A1E4SYH2_9ASCO|nr:hypothetical protein CANARDRAFT_200903 [[Candida] arabinofermentans NRRL YB-2248]
MPFEQVNKITNDAIFDNNKTKPINLTKVEVFGGDEFSNNFFKKLLSPLLTSADMTMAQLINGCNQSVSALTYTNCFDKITLDIQDSSSENESLKSIIDSKPIDLKAVFNLSQSKQKNLVIGSIHENQGNLSNLKYVNNNTFGNAELFKFQINLTPPSTGIKTPLKNLKIQYKAPMVDTSLKLYAEGDLLSTKNSIYQSVQQSMTSGSIGLEKTKMGFNCGGNGVLVNFAELNLSKRTTLQVIDSANDEIKTFAGDHTKLGLKLGTSLNTIQYLQKSKGKIGLNGYKLEFINEFAGLPNSNNSNLDEKFIKSEFNTKLIKSALNNGLTLDFSFGFGILKTLNSSSLNSKAAVHYQDKFYLNIPGYSTIEPKVVSSGAAGEKTISGKIGGLGFLNYDLKLMSRLLFVDPVNPLRLYVGLKGGELSTDGFKIDDFKNTLKSKSLNSLFKNWKNGCSIGLSYQIDDVIDMDLNYKFPIVTNSNTLGNGGFGFSVSINGDY